MEGMDMEVVDKVLNKIMPPKIDIEQKLKDLL